MGWGIGGQGRAGIGNAGGAGAGPNLTDAQEGAVMIGYQLVTSLLSQIGQKPFRPGYRMVGPGVWGYRPPETIDQLNPAGSQFYSAQQYPLYDDGSGSVTHVAGTVIKNPIHIHKYRAQMLAGEPDSSFTWGLDVFGSYQQAAARLDLLSFGGLAWDVMYRVSKPETPDETAARLMSQGPFCIWRSINTGKWMAEVYPVGGAISASSVFVDSDFQTVRWSLARDVKDTPGPSTSLLEDCANEIHVRWRMFAPTGAFTKDTWVSPSGSDDGDGVADESGAGQRADRMFESIQIYGIKGSLPILCDQITHKKQAQVLRNFAADRLYRPRIVVPMKLWALAEGLEPNMITYLDDDWGARYGVPLYPGQTGSQRRWSSIPFRVAQVELEMTSEGDECAVILEEVL